MQYRSGLKGVSARTFDELRQENRQICTLQTQSLLCRKETGAMLCEEEFRCCVFARVSPNCRGVLQYAPTFIVKPLPANNTLIWKNLPSIF